MSLYVLLYNDGLPKIGSILKLRSLPSAVEEASDHDSTSVSSIEAPEAPINLEKSGALANKGSSDNLPLLALQSALTLAPSVDDQTSQWIEQRILVNVKTVKPLTAKALQALCSTLLAARIKNIALRQGTSKTALAKTLSSSTIAFPIGPNEGRKAEGTSRKRLLSLLVKFLLNKHVVLKSTPQQKTSPAKTGKGRKQKSKS